MPRLSISEISDRYQKSAAFVRLKLKKGLQGLDEQRQKGVWEEGHGRLGHRYDEEFVSQAMGALPARHLSDTQRRIFGRKAKGPSITVISGKVGDPLAGILASRQEARNEYTQLIEEMAEGEHHLRIRCITGTDFFDSQSRFYGSLTKRKEQKLEKPLVLLVYPFERAAKIRSSAEGEKLAESQFRRDARGTYEFMNSYSPLVEAMWVDEVPPSLLIWTDKMALVEPYDYGGRVQRVGCLGRKAPVLVIPCNTSYHSALKDSFDYLYEGKCPHIKSYDAKQVAARYAKEGRGQLHEGYSRETTSRKPARRGRKTRS